MVEERESVSFGGRISGRLMGSRTGKVKKFVSAVRTVKAVTTIAVVVVPVAATVGAMVGYGAYTLVKKLKQRP